MNITAKIRITPTVAHELYMNNEQAKVAELEELGLTPLYKKDWKPGTYLLNETAIEELQSWSAFAIQNAYENDEPGTSRALQALYKQTFNVIGRRHEIG
jgi:hypothetical protein